MKVIGNYRILNQIAEGGFGRTYLAEQILLGTKVCIKHAINVSDEDQKLLLEEAKAIWDLRHFGIPSMRDVIRLDDNSLALVMSYIPGPTLAQYIEKHRKLDAIHVAWITERCINILKYLHFHGVVHGDIKPANIIIDGDKHAAVLVDFGLSEVKPSRTSVSKGYTLLYASPEQIDGTPILPESDFYSLGMTMIHALGGDIENRRIPNDVPEPIRAFIKDLLAPDVLYRPNWRKVNLQEVFQTVREKSFGSKTSGMKALPKL